MDIWSVTVNFLVTYAICLIFMRFGVFYVRMIVNTYRTYRSRKVQNEQNLVKPCNLCPIPCYAACCTIAECLDRNMIEQEAFFASAKIPKGDSFHG